MNKKDIENCFALHNNSINTLTESYHDLFKRVKRLERTCDAFLSNEFKTPNQLRIEELHLINGGLDAEIKRVKNKNNEINKKNIELCSENNKLAEENEELRKALNIYYDITKLKINHCNMITQVGLRGERGVCFAELDYERGRILQQAWFKYCPESFEYQPGQKPKYQPTKEEQEEWNNRCIVTEVCNSMEKLVESTRNLAMHLQKRQIYLSNPKTLKVPLEFMLEDAKYNFPFLREKRVWALDTCRTNVIRIEVMYGKPYYYDFNRQSLTAIEVLMED